MTLNSFWQGVKNNWSQLVLVGSIAMFFIAGWARDYVRSIVLENLPTSSTPVITEDRVEEIENDIAQLQAEHNKDTGVIREQHRDDTKRTDEQMVRLIDALTEQ